MVRRTPNLTLEIDYEKGFDILTMIFIEIQTNQVEVGMSYKVYDLQYIG